MQSYAVGGQPGPGVTVRGEHAGAGQPSTYAFGREGRQFRQPRSIPSCAAPALPGQTRVAPDASEPGDDQLDDLIYSWRRLTDPKLRKLALQIIQSMAA